MDLSILNSVPPPSILQLEVTKNCNLRCIMCHKGQMPDGVDFNRKDITDVILAQLSPVYKHLKHAMLFGDGEPMIYSKFWNIVNDIRSASSQCAIDFINNGTMMHEKNIKNCLDYKVSHMGLSVGGATPESHNYIRKDSDFDQIVDNFKMLKEMKIQAKTFEPYVTALIVVMQSNYREIVDLVKLCSDLNFYDIHLQKLFVTHPSMECEAVSDEEVNTVFKNASVMAQKRKIGFIHYPISNGNYNSYEYCNFDLSDRFFQPKYNKIDTSGYCKYQQPWNSIYVLHDGKVVPDCHWWSSSYRTDLNNCGILNEQTNIFDIWYGAKYQKIRHEISKGVILPQCRGCGLSGGVTESFRSHLTDHTNPDQERKLVMLNVKT